MNFKRLFYVSFEPVEGQGDIETANQLVKQMEGNIERGINESLNSVCESFNYVERVASAVTGENPEVNMLVFTIIVNVKSVSSQEQYEAFDLAFAEGLQSMYDSTTYRIKDVVYTTKPIRLDNKDSQ